MLEVSILELHKVVVVVVAAAAAAAAVVVAVVAAVVVVVVVIVVAVIVVASRPSGCFSGSRSYRNILSIEYGKEGFFQ